MPSDYANVWIFVFIDVFCTMWTSCDNHFLNLKQVRFMKFSVLHFNYLNKGKLLGDVSLKSYTGVQNKRSFRIRSQKYTVHKLKILMTYYSCCIFLRPEYDQECKRGPFVWNSCMLLCTSPTETRVGHQWDNNTIASFYALIIVIVQTEQPILSLKKNQYHLNLHKSEPINQARISHIMLYDKFHQGK